MVGRLAHRDQYAAPEKSRHQGFRRRAFRGPRAARGRAGAPRQSCAAPHTRRPHDRNARLADVAGCRVRGADAGAAAPLQPHAQRGAEFQIVRLPPHETLPRARRGYPAQYGNAAPLDGKRARGGRRSAPARRHAASIPRAGRGRARRRRLQQRARHQGALRFAGCRRRRRGESDRDRRRPPHGARTRCDGRQRRHRARAHHALHPADAAQPDPETAADEIDRATDRVGDGPVFRNGYCGLS